MAVKSRIQHILPKQSLSSIPSPIASPIIVRSEVSSDIKPLISNAIWGPALWSILHHACEKIGSQHLSKLPQEESRIWIGLLQSLRYSLPCPQCKKHYSVYFGTRSITQMDKEFLRTWLYELHEQVNQRLEKPSFPTESLPQYDTMIHFTEQVAIVHDQMLKAVRQGWSSANDVQRTIRLLMEMKCFYDFI